MTSTHRQIYRVYLVINGTAEHGVIPREKINGKWRKEIFRDKRF